MTIFSPSSIILCSPLARGLPNRWPTDAPTWQENSLLSLKRTKPSLSIVNPLDVLRQRIILEMARRQMRENTRQVRILLRRYYIDERFYCAREGRKRNKERNGTSGQWSAHSRWYSHCSTFGGHHHRSLQHYRWCHYYTKPHIVGLLTFSYANAIIVLLFLLRFVYL